MKPLVKFLYDLISQPQSFYSLIQRFGLDFKPMSYHLSVNIRTIIATLVQNPLTDTQHITQCSCQSKPTQIKTTSKCLRINELLAPNPA